MRSSNDAKSRPGSACRAEVLALPLLEGAQRSACSAQAGHQGAKRNIECGCGFLVGEPLNRDEMQHRALLVRQAQEGLLDLLEPYPAFLICRHRRERELSHTFAVSELCVLPPSLIDERVVQDREQPGAQVTAGPEGPMPLIS